MSRLVLSQITIKKERSISSTTWYYLLQPSNASAPDSTNYGNPPPIYSDTGYSGWSTTEPTYTVGDDRVLYTMVQTLYSDNTFSYSTPTISSSYEAAKDAYNEVVQAEQDILELQELGLANGYVWDNMTYVAPTSTIPVYPIGSYIASGTLVNGSRTITRSNSNTYGLNTWISTGGINLRYNAIDLMKLTTSNLEFYYPSTSSQGTKAISLGTNGAINSLVFYGFNNSNKTVELTNSALNFYNTNGTLTSSFGNTISLASNGASITIGSSQNEHITIDTNGLKIYGNYSYNNNGIPTPMYGLLGSFGDSVQIGPLNTGHIILNTTGATFYDSADTTIGVIGNTDLYYSTESYEEIVEVNWVSGETFTYDKQFNYDTIINSVLIAVKNGDTIDWSSAQTVTSPWRPIYINLNDTMVPITISPSAVTGRTDCIFSSTSTNPTTDTTLAFKINHTPSMPGPHYSFGIDSIAPGTGSFAAGRGIKAVGPYQTVLGRYNKKDLDASFIIGNGTSDANRSNLFVVDGNGNLRVNNGFQIYNNDETDSIAEFGTTARIGKINNSHFLMNANSLQAYNSSNQLYFEVSNAGIRFGNNLSSTVATQTDVVNASYSVEIQVTSIDYTNNSATLVAIPYYQGSTILPTGVTLSYQWYKNGSALENASTAPTITGATTNTLQLGEGTDFGSSTTNAIYTCVIS